MQREPPPLILTVRIQGRFLVFFIILSTSAVSSIKLGSTSIFDTHLCKLRDTPAAPFYSKLSRFKSRGRHAIHHEKWLLWNDPIEMLPYRCIARRLHSVPLVENVRGGVSERSVILRVMPTHGIELRANSLTSFSHVALRSCLTKRLAAA